jgi:hypothetical protein
MKRGLWLWLAGGALLVLVFAGLRLLTGTYDHAESGLRVEWERPVEGEVPTEYYTVLNRSDMEHRIPVLVDLLEQARDEKGAVIIPEEWEGQVEHYLQEQAGPRKDWRETVFEGAYYDFERHVQ